MRILFVCMIIIAIFTTGALAEQNKVLNIKEIVTPKGIKVWYIKDESLPIISLSFGFDGAGSINDTAKKQGLARLLSNSMDEGAGKYESQEFQKILADKSISLYFSNSRDNFTGSLKTLSKYSDTAFELLDLAINEPRFDEEPIERMKKANIARIKSSLSDPEWISARIMNDVAFAGHPYAQNSGGSIETINAINADDLKEFIKAHFGINNLKVAIIGDIEEDEVKKNIDKIFGNLPQVKLNEPKDVSIQSGGKIIVYEMDIPQSVIDISQDGIDRTHEDYHAAQVMNHILGGGGFGSRLTEEIREKRGLTYGIYSSLYSMNHANLFKIGTSTENKNASEAVSIIKEEIRKISTEGVSEEELTAAINYLIGSLPLSLSSTDKISGLMLSLQLSGRTSDYLDIRKKKIENLTIKDIKRVASFVLNPDNMTIVITGKPDEGIKVDRRIKNIPNAE